MTPDDDDLEPSYSDVTYRPEELREALLQFFVNCFLAVLLGATLGSIAVYLVRY